MAYDADECAQALPAVDALKRASLRESLACEATGLYAEDSRKKRAFIYESLSYATPVSIT